MNKNRLYYHQLGTTDIAKNMCIIIELSYCDHDRSEPHSVRVRGYFKKKKNYNHYRKQSVTLNFWVGFF